MLKIKFIHKTDIYSYTLQFLSINLKLLFNTLAIRLFFAVAHQQSGSKEYRNEFYERIV
ncbi:hypothetical protein Flavo103_02530 [Flavobacterium collinsii]|nr:hypothetical protein Flavo103_02530 [Flavobacterium collinsii]